MLVFTKSPNYVNIDKTDNDEDFLFLNFNNVDEYFIKNDRIKY